MSFLPVADRELRVASRRKATYWTRVAAAAVGIGTFFWIWLGEIIQQIPSTGSRPFELLTQFAFIFCLAAGVIFSADSLSNERRDGTLGLLFLTDLEGYDVIFGKLVSTSFRAIYGFGSLAPILALPIILGGITSGQFARVILALAVTLFLSISLSLLISSSYRKSTTAQVVTAVLLILLSISDFGRARLVSPHHLYLVAFDYFYDLNPPEYWLCVSSIVMLGIIALATACWMLPRTWRDRIGTAPTGPIAEVLLRIPAPLRTRHRDTPRLLERRPFSWLVMWGALPEIWLWLPVVICAVGLLSISRIARSFWMLGAALVLLTGLLHLILKVWMAFEASKRFSEDRHNGTLELVLGTGIEVKTILADYRDALRRRLTGPLATVFGVDILLVFMVSTNTGPALAMLAVVVATFGALLIDLYTLSWVGMWMGITSRKPSRAALGTLWRVVVVPIIIFVGLLLIAGLQLQGSFELILAWFSIGILNNISLFTLAYRGTHEEFRKVAHWHVEDVDGISESATSSESQANAAEAFASSSPS